MIVIIELKKLYEIILKNVQLMDILMKFVIR